MAKIVTVSLYSIRVTPTRKEKQSEKLDQVGGSLDLFEILISFFDSLRGQIVATEDDSRQLSVPSPMEVDQVKRVIYGNIEVGSSGYGSSLRDRKSGKESYRRKTTDSEMIPLHVRFWVPKSEQRAIFALQSFGEAGCKSILTAELLSFWAQKAEGFVLRISEIVPRSAYDELMKNRQISKIRLIHHGIPGDIADAYQGNALDPTLGRMELSFYPQRGALLGGQALLQRLFERKSFASKGIIEIDNFEPHEVKVELKDKNNRKQVVTFADVIKAHASHDVSDIVTRGLEGHPEYQSIKEICMRLLVNVAKEM